MSVIGRYWRTIRHLRPSQVFARLWFQLARPRPGLLPAPNLRSVVGTWRIPAQRTASLLKPGLFSFLNDRGHLANYGWDSVQKTKLWRYNQHYFDDLNAQGASDRRDWHNALLADWILSNPPYKGTGWEPYPTSLRIVNWVKWLLAGNKISEEGIDSLATQTRFLVRRLEWHLLGNHLFANAKALVFAGLFFEGPEAEGWLRKGLQILQNEIPEQILGDGAQFELSPMYHALAVEDLLDLINVANTFGRQDLTWAWREKVPAMLLWLEAMSHPDGQIAFFNDAAFGIAPSNTELLEYANKLGFANAGRDLSVLHLKESGYVRLSAGHFLIIADFGQIGPDYLPGHAHADTLSFELSISSQRVFVNSGTSVYGACSERLRQRGTAAHNTVIVVGKNSSEVWSGFRVGRRARPRGIRVEKCDGILRAQASHDGYAHLPGQPIVTRCIQLEQERLVIHDSISITASAEARYHLHPSICVSSLSADCAVLELPTGQRLMVTCEGGMLRKERATWHPEFGISEQNCCLVLPLVEGRATLSMMVL